MRFRIEDGGVQVGEVVSPEASLLLWDRHHVNIDYASLPKGTNTSKVRKPLSGPNGYSFEGFIFASPANDNKLMVYDGPHPHMATLQAEFIVPDGGLRVSLRRYNVGDYSYTPSEARNEQPLQVTIRK